MKDIRIIAVYKAQNDELIKKYELANKHSCPIEEGQVWISTNAERPQGICSEIWKHIKKIVTSLALDEKIDIEGQMKNSNSALVSCNNGFRPVTFYIETVELENIYPTEEDYMNAIGNPISTLSSLKRLRPYINIDGSIEFWKDDNFIVFKMIDSIVEDYVVSFKCVLNQNALNYLDIENNVNSRVYTQELYIERMNKKFDIMVIRGYEKPNNSSTEIINKLNDEEEFYLSDDGKTILGWKRASGFFGKSLKHSISIPDYVEKIADFAFAGCDNLGYVFIPKSVKYIGNFAFAGCGTIDFAFESDSLDFLGESAFYDCRIKGPDRYVQSFYMPNSIVKCHKKAFNNAIIRGSYGKNKYVQLYKGNNENLMKLADYEFMSKENEILKLRNECNNDAAINIEGILYDSSRRYIIRCENKNIKTLHIPQGVKGIFYEAFCGCGDLENVIFNDDIEFIAENAFRGTNIENLILPKSVNYIGQCAFYRCKNLKTIKMSCNLKEIIGGTFEECSSLVHIELSPNIESIGNMSFARCGSLKEITLPKNLIEIGSLAFYMCALSKIELPSKVSVLGTSPFSGCSNIKVTSKNGLVESCGPFILSYWKQRLIGYSGDEQNIVIPTTVKALLAGCLAHRKRTSDIRLPNTITHISKRTFLYCQGRSINIPSSVRYLGRSIYCIDKIYTTREQYLEFSNKEPRLYKPILEVSDIRKIDDSTYEITE